MGKVIIMYKTVVLAHRQAGSYPHHHYDRKRLNKFIEDFNAGEHVQLTEDIYSSYSILKNES